MFNSLCFEAHGNPATWGGVIHFNSNIALISPIAVTSDTFFSVASTKLLKLTKYYWMVKAYDNYNDSAISRTFYFTTKDPNANKGGAEGFALFQGWIKHSGIKIGFYDTTGSVNPRYSRTNDSGYYSMSGMFPTVYMIIADDTLKNGFVNDTTY